MAVVARYLIDTSAAARMHQPTVAARLSPLIDSGLVATCAPLDFEALYCARTPSEYEQVRADRAHAYEYLSTEDVDWQRALGIQRDLAQQSRLRAVGIADLLVASVAERHRVELLHFDSDFDMVAEITRQPMSWAVPRGSVA